MLSEAKHPFHRTHAQDWFGHFLWDSSLYSFRMTANFSELEWAAWH